MQSAFAKTWYLDGVTFDDGTKATGSFDYDAGTGKFSNMKIVTTAGYTYLDEFPPMPGNENALALVPDAVSNLSGSPMLALGFEKKLTNSGGTITLRKAGFAGKCSTKTCDDGSFSRYIQSGQVTTTAPPSPPAPAPTTPGTGPAPEPSPTPEGSSPSPPSGGTGGGGMCFSRVNDVEVQGKGFISMDSLQIGDYVRAGNNKFSRVFSLIHTDRDMEAEFLQIHSGALKKPLEVTPDHMVFIDSSAVRASEVKVGDTLGENKVSKITSVKRRGVFAPVTESGDIVVNGILASSYAAVLAHCPVNVQHSGAQAFFAVRRLLCAFNFGNCEKETHTDGIADWLLPVFNLFSMTNSSPIIQFCAVVVAVPFLAAVYTLEQLLLGPLFVKALALFSCLAIYKNAKRSKTKCV